MNIMGWSFWCDLLVRGGRRRTEPPFRQSCAVMCGACHGRERLKRNNVDAKVRRCEVSGEERHGGGDRRHVLVASKKGLEYNGVHLAVKNRWEVKVLEERKSELEVQRESLFSHLLGGCCSVVAVVHVGLARVRCVSACLT